MELNQESQILQQEIAPYTEFFSWGSDQYGQLALANPDDEDQYNTQPQFSDIPKSLSFDIIIKQISCGENHAGFISGDSFVFCVGRNQEGQLGVGDPALLKSSAPLLVDALPKDDFNYPIQISCGGNHSAVVMKNGELYTWGQGSHGATGLNSMQNTYAPILVEFKKDQVQRQIAYVSCGKRHTLILDSNGKVLASGENNFRQLGIPHVERVGEFTPVPEFPHRAKKVDAGIDHSLILTTDNNIYGAGNNKFGNLGLGHTYSSDSFLLVHGLATNLKFKEIQAKRHSGALTEDGRLFVWGQVFMNEQPLLLPQELKSNKAIICIAVGDDISAIIDGDNHVYSWGFDNRYGQLGRQDNFDSQDNCGGMPQIIDSLVQKQVTQISIGQNFCIALGLDFDENGNPISRINNSRSGQQQNQFQSPTNERYNGDFQGSSALSQERPSERINNQDDYQRRDQRQEYQYNPSTQPSQQVLYQPIRQEQIESNQQNTQHFKGDQSQISQQSSKKSIIDSGSNYKNYQDRQAVTSAPDIGQPIRNYDSTERLTKTNKDRPTTPSYSQTNLQSNLNNAQYQSPYIPGQTSSNVELYKQLDQLRQENFELKQKQRELMQNLNILKQENEQLLVHTDEEIKRMSDFVDKFTQEVDLTKKQMEDEYEAKLRTERVKCDELKLKMHHEQTLIDQKLDRLQREIELLKQENQNLKSEKTQQSDKHHQAIEQIEKLQLQLKQTEHQLQKLQSLEREKTLSPNLNQLNRYSGYDEQTPLQRTPNGYQSRPPVAGNAIERPSQYQRKNDNSDIGQQQPQQFQTIKSNDSGSYNRFHLEGTDGVRDKSASKEYQGLREDSRNHQKGYQDQRTDNSPFNNQRGAAARNQNNYDLKQENTTPSRYTPSNTNIYSPMRQQREQEPLQYSSSRDPAARYRQNQQQQLQSMYNQPSDTQTISYEQQHLQYKSQADYGNHRNQQNPQRSLLQEKSDNYIYQQQQRPLQQDNASSNQLIMSPEGPSQPRQDSIVGNSSYHKYDQSQFRQRSPRQQQPSTSAHQSLLNGNASREILQRPAATIDDQIELQAPVVEKSSALNDVKNRLMIMQKNKEELEEKLRNYEAKIRQHFNKQ